jgi:hypothetical protein
MTQKLVWHRPAGYRNPRDRHAELLTVEGDPAVIDELLSLPHVEPGDYSLPKRPQKRGTRVRSPQGREYTIVYYCRQPRKANRKTGTKPVLQLA